MMPRAIGRRASLRALLRATAAVTAATAACVTPALLPARWALTARAADAYPSRPIRMIVPYAVGGGVDIVARTIGQALGERLGQPVVIDNKPGAGSNIGSDAVAKSSPDGYTLLMASPANAVNLSLYKKMPYDTRRDLAPVVLVGSVPSVLIVHPSIPAQTLAEFVALAKAKPGTLNFGSGGNGTSEHLTAEMFKAVAGIDLVHVPYKGGSAALNDLLGGQVSLMFVNQVLALPYIRSGKVRALAVADARRSSVLPDVPTFAEGGYPGFEVSVWWGLMAAAGTPAEIVGRLNREVNQALASADVRQQLDTLGARPIGGTPDAFAAFLVAEIARWQKAVQVSGAQVE